MDYCHNPIYGYDIDFNTMCIYANLVKKSILNNTKLPLSSDPRFSERNRFVKEFYNVIKDFYLANHCNPSFRKIYNFKSN